MSEEPTTYRRLAAQSYRLAAVALRGARQYAASAAQHRINRNWSLYARFTQYTCEELVTADKMRTDARRFSKLAEELGQ